MSFMTHLSHGSVPMGPLARKIITNASISLNNTFLFTPGKYIVHGRFGDSANSVDPAPAVTNGPIELTDRYPGSMGYTMLIDVEVLPDGTGIYADNVAQSGGRVRKMDVSIILRTIAGDARYWNSDVTTQAKLVRTQGVMSWTRTQTLTPATVSNAPALVSEWTDWVPVTSNITRSATLPARLVNGVYALELSLGSNWFIDNYSPLTPIGVYFNASVYAKPRGLATYDGIVTVTLNSIQGTGVPAFVTESGLALPSWVKDFQVTAAKRGRLILDYSGSLATVMGVDLPGTTSIV